MHLHQTLEPPFPRTAQCHQAANVPDSVTMIHLDKQEDEAIMSSTMAMPIGDTLLSVAQSTHHVPMGPRVGAETLGAIIP